MKKKLILLVAVLVLASFSVVTAQQTRRDGNWWTTLPEYTKSEYILGFFDGMETGHSFSVWGLMDKQKSQSFMDATTSYTDYNSKYMSNVTVGQVVAGLNSFYSDYRNRRIFTNSAVWVILNAISGKPEQEIRQMTDNFRKNTQ